MQIRQEKVLLLVFLLLAVAGVGWEEGKRIVYITHIILIKSHNCNKKNDAINVR